MENSVIAAPEHKLYAGANFTQGRWSVSTGIQYIAGLYTSTDPATTENFVLWNLRGQFRAAPWLDIWARGKPAGTALRNQCRIPDAESYGDGRYKSELLIDKLQYI